MNYPGIESSIKEDKQYNPLNMFARIMKLFFLPVAHSLFRPQKRVSERKLRKRGRLHYLDVVDPDLKNGASKPAPFSKSKLVMILWLVFWLVLFLCIHLSITKLQAQQETQVPTIMTSYGKYQLKTPDWSRISWSSLPPVQTSGEITLPEEVVQQLGYNPSRVWTAGQNPSSIVMLGDIQDAFKVSSLTLKSISSIITVSKNLSLDNFGLVQWQTPTSLLKAIPSLGNLDITQVKPIQDVFAVAGVLMSGKISQLIEQNPYAASIPLKNLNLKSYSIDSIPGLWETELGVFNEWQRSFISQVPGLSNLPMSQIFNGFNIGNLQLGVASTMFGESEYGEPKSDANRFISGTVNSLDQTIPVPCSSSKKCAYMELGDLGGKTGALYGKRWVSGSSQKVKGGFGILARVNGGLEPTGRLVYGNGFKIVLTGTNEQKGTADFGLYFRACAHLPFGGKTCTPYFIGSVPWLSTHENDLVVVGI